MTVLESRAMQIRQISALVRCMVVAGVPCLVPLMNPVLPHFIQTVVDLGINLISGRYVFLADPLGDLLGLGVDVGCAGDLHLLLHLTQLELECDLHDTFLFLLLLVLEELLHGPLAAVPDARCRLGPPTHLRVAQQRGLVRYESTFFYFGRLFVLLQSCYLLLFFINELLVSLLELL